jgi:hypothetical protein
MPSHSDNIKNALSNVYVNKEMVDDELVEVSASCFRCICSVMHCVAFACGQRKLLADIRAHPGCSLTVRCASASMTVLCGRVWANRSFCDRPEMKAL